MKITYLLIELPWILGMDVNQLRHELAQGVRLPKPEHCSDNISDIIQRCFNEDPKDRPDFVELKLLIENAYDLLISRHNESDVSNQESDMLLYENITSLTPSQDDRMKERYLDMRRKNKKGCKTEHDGMNGNVFEMEDEASVALRSSKRQYISLENVYSSASMVPLHGSGEDLTRASDVRKSLLSSNYRPASIVSNKYKQLSPACNDVKCFFSSSAINTISQTLEIPERERKISQSWNPLYMIVESDININEPNGIEKIAQGNMDGASAINPPTSSKQIA